MKATDQMKTSSADSISRNTAVVRRLIEEVFNRGNLDVANELLDDIARQLGV